MRPWWTAGPEDADRFLVALRIGLATAVQRWLPAWAGRLSPHGLRHFCASSPYERGVDLKAIQELLGHDWLSTTTQYIHLHDGHIERAVSNQRLAARLGERVGGSRYTVGEGGGQ